VLSLQLVIFLQYGRKDLLYQYIKEDQRHRINVNRTDLLHFYVRFTNILRRIYSQEFNIGLKHFQLYYQTSSSMDSANLKIVFQRFLFCLKPCCLLPNFTVLILNFFLSTTINIRITLIAGIGNFTIILRNTSAISIGSRYVMLLVRTCKFNASFWYDLSKASKRDEYHIQQIHLFPDILCLCNYN
jgi:hypothetical protein